MLVEGRGSHRVSEPGYRWVFLDALALRWVFLDALALDVGLGGAHKGVPKEEILQGPQKMPLTELWPQLCHTGGQSTLNKPLHLSNTHSPH